MHRVLNIKHRVVRRVDIGKAPLATFDTVDLGDEDVKSNQKNCNKTVGESSAQKPSQERVSPAECFLKDEGLKTEIIGGNNSKKSLSQAGGEETQGKDVEAAKDSKERRSSGEKVQSAPEPTLTGVAPSQILEKCSPAPEKCPQKSEEIGGRSDEKNGDATNTVALASASLTRQGTLGRVTLPIKKQDSDSSSSSVSSCNESTFTFHATRPSIGHLDTTDSGRLSHRGSDDRDFEDSLIPVNLDPSQILSPSKRKAYEKRIERLKVTTSPIARPRSTAPISVVTLDEYSAISSPEASPASPSAIPDKLKITLPVDEFTKPKTPKVHSAKRKDSDENCFEFTEEILFSRTKSALVVDEEGHLPLSPRRVLIPPTLTPAASPKLSAGPRLSQGTLQDEAGAAPKLIYIQNNETAHKFFGDTVDETENDNWADFPDSSTSIEKAEVESSEKEERIVASGDVSLKSQPRTRTARSEGNSSTLSSRVSAWQEAYAVHGDKEGEAGQHGVISDSSQNVEVGDLPHDLSCLSKSKKLRIVTPKEENKNEVNQPSEIEQNIDSPISEIPTVVIQPQTPSAKVKKALRFEEEEEEEEILMVEIHQFPDGKEQHIDIDVKSSSSSESPSPVCSDTNNTFKHFTVADNSHDDKRKYFSVSDPDNERAVREPSEKPEPTAPFLQSPSKLVGEPHLSDCPIELCEDEHTCTSPKDEDLLTIRPAEGEKEIVPANTITEQTSPFLLDYHTSALGQSDLVARGRQETLLHHERQESSLHQDLYQLQQGRNEEILLPTKAGQQTAFSQETKPLDPLHLKQTPPAPVSSQDLLLSIETDQRQLGAVDTIQAAPPQTLLPQFAEPLVPLEPLGDLGISSAHTNPFLQEPLTLGLDPTTTTPTFPETDAAASSNLIDFSPSPSKSSSQKFQ